MFVYCINNPVRYIDSYGNVPDDILLKNAQLYEAGGNILMCGSANNSRNASKAIRPTTSGKTVVIYDDGVTPSSLVLNNPNNVVAYDKRYGTDNPNIQVLNSWLIEDPTIQRQILEVLYNYDQLYPAQAVWGRSVDSMLVEWDAHNIFALFDQSARDTDFDHDEEGKNFAYFCGKAVIRGFEKHILPYLPFIP